MLVAGLILTPVGSLANVSHDTLEQADVVVRFEISLRAAANEVAAEFPRIKADLEALFGWRIIHRPTIFLIKSRERFRHMAGHPFIIAFAVPMNNLIVIDYGRLNRGYPFRKNLLKHELVHLLLHAHIPGNRLPKWFEEGVAQWASDGVADLLEEPRSAELTEAILSDNLLPFAALANDFPDDNRGLILAYAQSRSMVFFMADTYGADNILKILDSLKDGSGFEESIRRVFSVSLTELEQKWMSSQRRPSVKIAMLAGYLYEILFVAAALMTVAGFIRFRFRKRRYRDEDDD
jgi:hypothetical protein